MTNQTVLSTIENDPDDKEIFWNVFRLKSLCSPWTTTWLLGTSICWPSLVCAYCRMVAPGWAAAAAALVMVRV